MPPRKAAVDRAWVGPSVEVVHARGSARPSPEHAHDAAMIFVPLSGALRFEIAGVTYVADAQHALAVRANTPHRHAGSDAGDIEYLVAYVDDRLVDQRGRRTEPALRFANTAFVRELIGELLSELAVDDRQPEADVVAALALLLARQIVRDPAVHVEAPLPDDERLARAIRLARERFRDDLTTADLAKAAGMSPRTFERALVRACGTTPRQLVEDLRLAEARARLATGRETVTAVAYDLGYKSLSHFVRRFRRAFGTTPTGATRP